VSVEVFLSKQSVGELPGGSELSSATQLSFTVQGRIFKAQQWGDPSGKPVLALHGWLDNSASFYRLGPLLKGVNLIAVDMAGHGFSDHRLGVRPYNIWEDVSEIMALADELDWQRFSLLGHSRGAIISALIAGAFPERIEYLALLEGIWPASAQAEQAPEQLAQSILDAQKTKRLRVLSDLSSMIGARLKGVWPLSEASATALTERGVREVEGGYCWSTDGQLMNASAVKLTDAHFDAFTQRLSMPVKLLLAEEGLLKNAAGFMDKLSHYPFIDVHCTPGTHHWHMEQQAPLLAGLLNDFFQLEAEPLNE